MRMGGKEAVAFVAAMVGDAVLVGPDEAGIGLDLVLGEIFSETVGRGRDEQGVERPGEPSAFAGVVTPGQVIEEGRSLVCAAAAAGGVPGPVEVIAHAELVDDGLHILVVVGIQV